MNKLSVLVLFVFLFQLLLTSCGGKSVENVPGTTADGNVRTGSETTQANEDDPNYLAKHSLLSDWSGHLWYVENLYGDMLWAISYLEQFAENQTWENLQLARAAVCTAEIFINGRQPQETEMTKEQLDLLLGSGYDVSNVAASINEDDNSKYDILQDCNILKYYLFNEVFYKSALYNLSEEISALKEYYRSCLTFSSLETNYILAELDDDYWTERLVTFIDENFPYLSEIRPELSGDSDEIFKAGTEEMDRQEEIVARLNIVIGNEQLLVDEISEMLRSGDINKLRESELEIEGIPLMLPDTGWDVIENATYYYSYVSDGDDGKETVTPVKAYDDLTACPDRCIIECYDISRENVLEYMDRLSDLGIECVDLADDDNKLSLYYLIGESTIVFDWADDNTATIYLKENSVLFAPEWYIHK